MEKIFKQKKGITLIALVITIIVLLILAGISISMLSGNNGVLQKATNAKEYTDNSQITERVQLAYTAALTDGNGTLTEVNLRNELTNEFKDNGYDLSEDKTTNEWVIKINEVERLRVSKGSVATSKTLVQAFKDGEIKIGDYLNYSPSNTSASVTMLKDGIKNQTTTGIGTGYDAEQTFTVDTTSEYKTTWRVLGINEAETNLILISGSPIRKNGDDPYLVLQGAESYIYGKKTLDAICNIYANTNLANEVRSITIDDINTALGVKVDYTTNTDGTKTPSKVYEKENPETNIDTYSAFESYEYRLGDYSPENSLGTGNKKIGDKVYRTAYYYYMNSLTKSDNTAKDLIFDGTLYTTNHSKSYWVASPGAIASDYDASFGLGVVHDEDVGCGNKWFFSSSGEWLAGDYAVRPVVSLKSNITTEQLQVQSGIEEKNWTTSVGNIQLDGYLDSSKAINE